jgi:hypothetical protein
MRFLVARRRWSMLRSSSSSSWASSRRAVAAVPCAVISSRARIACAAEISRENPPGTRSQSTACNRHTVRLRARLRSRCRRAQTLSTAACSSVTTVRTSGERSAAIATERASFGSFLFTCPVLSSRTRAASFGWTSRTCSPAATSCCANRWPSPRAPSIAQTRSGQRPAHSSRPSSCLAEARIRICPSRFSLASSANAVCDPVWGSIPIITSATHPPTRHR